MSRFREAMKRAVTPEDSMSVERVQSAGVRGVAQLDGGLALIVGHGWPRPGELCSVVKGIGDERYALRTPVRRRRPQVTAMVAPPEWEGQFGAEITPVFDTQWLRSATAAAFEDSGGNPWLINVDRPGDGVNTRITFYRGNAADRRSGWIAKAFINIYGYSGHPVYGTYIAGPDMGGPALIYDMSRDRGYIAYVHASFLPEKFVVRRFDVDAAAGTLTLQAANEYTFQADGDGFVWPANTETLDGCLAPDGTPMFGLLCQFFRHAAPYLHGRVGVTFEAGTFRYAAGFVGPWGVIGPAQIRARLVSEEPYGAWGSGYYDYPQCELIQEGALPFNWYTYRYVWAWEDPATHVIYESPAGRRSNSFYPTSGPPAYRTVRHNADYKAYKEDCHIRVYRRNWGVVVPPSRLVDYDFTNYFYIGEMHEGDELFFDDGLPAGALYIHPPVNRLRYGRTFVASLPTGPPGTTARRIYRTKRNGSTYYKVADFAGNEPVLWSFPDEWEDTVEDVNLVEQAVHAPDVQSMFEVSSHRVVVLRSGIAGDWGSPTWEFPADRVKRSGQIALAQPTTDMTVAVVAYGAQHTLDYIVKAGGSWGSQEEAAPFAGDRSVHIGSMLVFDGELFCSLAEYDPLTLKDFVVRGLPGGGDVAWEKGEAIHTRGELTSILANVLCICEEDTHLVTMLHDRHVYKLLWWNPDDEEWDETVAEEIEAGWPGGVALTWHGAPKVTGGLDTWYIDLRVQMGSPSVVEVRVTDWRGV